MILSKSTTNALQQLERKQDKPYLIQNKLLWNVYNVNFEYILPIPQIYTLDIPLLMG